MTAPVKAPPLAVGDEVERNDGWPGRGIITEAPATIAGAVMPGWIRVRQEDGIYSTDAVGAAKRWRRVTQIDGHTEAAPVDVPLRVLLVGHKPTPSTLEEDDADWRLP